MPESANAYIIPLEVLDDGHLPLAGGKAVKLGALARLGYKTPPGFVITTRAYQDFLAHNSLGEKLAMELTRKNFSEMRWEELWDSGLRIRNLFLKNPPPAALEAELRAALAQSFSQETALAIRSSSPAEDSGESSFAGLHESFIGIRQWPEIIDALRRVWASLWSDAALLYREELGLSVENAAMAVICQELIIGQSSGIMFTRAPDKSETTVIEAVHGLNEALVDGSVEPDRWFIRRDNGQVAGHQSPEKREMLRTGDKKIVSAPNRPPLRESRISQVFAAGQKLEKHFNHPQDVEWTFRGGELHLLQTRPVTAIEDSPDDQRKWYLSLKIKIDELSSLRREIEDELLPAMESESNGFSGVSLKNMPDEELLSVLESRRRRFEFWHDVYYEKFIPFAHGMRLFAEFYNDQLKPDDPYEFMDLLRGEELKSKLRNQKLAEMAKLLRQDSGLRAAFRENPDSTGNRGFSALYRDFIREYGSLDAAATGFNTENGGESILPSILLSMAEQNMSETGTSSPRKKDEKTWLQTFADEESREHAARLLEIARASYRLRDDDNIVLGRIEAGLLMVEEEAERRGLIKSRKTVSGGKKTLVPGVKPRQILGQPASKGFASGNARVIREHRDIAEMRAGEILVCDAIDPNMTFAIPLAAAVVERRGGMLIHGAIIAREYGLPCVTGIPDAVEIINTGDKISVDGFLGIVTIRHGL